MISAAVVLISSYLSNLKGSLLGTALILLGLPVLWFIRKFSKRFTVQSSQFTVRGG